MTQGVVNALWFSPTGTTRKIVGEIAKEVARRTNAKLREIDITPPQERTKELVFAKDEVVVFGVPVYAGRVPNIILDYLYSIKGNKAKVIAVVLYGNRHFDDALIELTEILKEDGFQVVGAGSFVGEHSFSRTLAAGRPNKEDIVLAKKLAEAVTKHLKSKEVVDVNIPGDGSALKYYQPQRQTGEKIDIRKVKPQVSEACNECGRCVLLCPMGSIVKGNVREYRGICIKCGACTKGCPQQARYIDDEGYLYHKEELEKRYMRDKDSAIYID